MIGDYLCRRQVPSPVVPPEKVAVDPYRDIRYCLFEIGSRIPEVEGRRFFEEKGLQGAQIGAGIDMGFGPSLGGPILLLFGVVIFDSACCQACPAWS